MTVQQIHEFIWDVVIDEIKKGHYMSKEDGEFEIKGGAIDQLQAEGFIDEQASDILYDNSRCVLCALYEKCHQCPICNMYGHCSDTEGIYMRACFGDLEAAEQIRDIVVLSGTNPNQSVIDDLEHVGGTHDKA